MSLPKLPPLPKKKTSADERKERLAANLAKLPSLGAFRSEWGGLEVGRWTEKYQETPTGETILTVFGVCARCGNETPGRDLKLRKLPFGRGEVWQCRECENEPKEAE